MHGPEVVDADVLFNKLAQSEHDRGAYAAEVRAAWLAQGPNRLRLAPRLRGDRVTAPRDRIAPVLFAQRAPEVPCRVAEDSEVPRVAQALLRRAREANWDAVVTYARGWTLHSTRSPSRLVESIAVRMRKGDRGAVVVWGDPQIACRYVWPPLRAVSDKELKVILAGDAK